MVRKKYFKMYKSGKLWVTAAVVGLSIAGGTALNEQQVKADTQTPAATVTQTQDQQGTGSQASQADQATDQESQTAQGQQGTDSKSAASDQTSQSGRAQDQQSKDQQDQSKAESQTINRQVNFSYADKSGQASTATQTATVNYTTDNSGKKTYDTKSASWTGTELTIPDGMAAIYNGKIITELPGTVALQDDGTLDDSPINIVFAKAEAAKDNPTADDLKNTDIYHQVTRTINVQNTTDSTKSTSEQQTVTFGRTKAQQADGSYIYSEWQPINNGKAAWSEYEIPKVDGYVSKIDDQDGYVTAVPAKDVSADTKDETVNVSYVAAQKTEEPTESNKNDANFWKEVTRTIEYNLGGLTNTTTQSVWFKRSRVTTTDASGKQTVTYTDWVADGNPTWSAVTIPQQAYYHTEVNGQRQATFPEKTVTANTPNEKYTVNYVSDATDPDNNKVKPGLQGNWAYIDGIHMTDTGIHVTGWNANSESFNRNYHFLIILDYGANPQRGQFREVGRKLITGGVNRPDVFKVYPVWNAATSGFDDTVTLNTDQIKAGDKLRILSRWSSDPTGNENYSDLYSSYYTMDYNTNLAWLDSMKVASDGQQLEVSGWNATNQNVGRKYHYVILFDATTNREISRQLVKDGISRPDVSKAYPNLLNASKSGFNVKFNLSGVDLGHNLQVISRYSDAANGEGSRVDYWFPARRLVTGDLNNHAYLDNVKADAKSGKVTFTGWNATNYSQLEPNHYIILFDTTANTQVDSIKLDSSNGLIKRNDVQRVFPAVKGADQSGFGYSIDMSKLTFGHTYALVSRYSSSAEGNGDSGAHVDYWFNNAFKFDQQAYYVDSMKFAEEQTPAADDKTADTTGSNDQKTDQPADTDKTTVNTKKLHVAGWMASDGAATFQHAFVIVLDAKNNRELGRSEVTLTDRPDVLAAMPGIYNAGKSGFNTDVDLTDGTKAQTDGVKLVLRFTNDKAGNGSPVADQWTAIYRYNAAKNEFDRE